jgi:hypothetical protein
MFDFEPAPTQAARPLDGVLAAGSAQVPLPFERPPPENAAQTIVHHV